MNITMNIDCSPEEARRLMGLPDLTPLHNIYIDKMRETMSEGLTPEAFEKMVRLWAPMGEAGVNAWRHMFEQITGSPFKA